MRVIWLRGRNTINFRRPFSWFTTGVRGSGKSSFLEAVAEQYLDRGNTILDLFGSRDGEGLGWLRSKWAEEKRILLVHGANVDVDCNFDTVQVDNLTLPHFEKYDLVISSSPLYSSPSSEFLEVNKITDMIYRRMSWTKLIYCLVREAANLYYSRLKVDPNQNQAKAAMIYLIREARHVGMAMGLDTLRLMSIDIDVRNVTDFLIFKSQGVMGLPREYHFLYRTIEPYEMARMPPNKFFVLSREGPFGVGEFKAIPWHKQEKEHILRVLGMKVEYGEELDYGTQRGNIRTMSDHEHIEIVGEYVQDHSQMAIASAKGRSPATINKQIKEHNEKVTRLGHCPRCKRAGGEFFELLVHKGRTSPNI